MFYKKLYLRWKIINIIWYLERLKYIRKELKTDIDSQINKADQETIIKQINELLGEYKYLIK